MALLEEKGEQIEVIEYLKTPPNESEIKRILTLLKLSPRELMRQGESEFKTLNLADATLSDEHLIRAMHENPRLIQRPIVIKNDTARIGRPPEDILEIL